MTAHVWTAQISTPIWLQQMLEIVGENVYARAGVILLGAMILAKLLDWFLTGALRAWARFTETDFDDKLIEASHGPIFVSVVLLGAWLALLEIDPRAEYLDKLFLPILKTVGLIVWSTFGLRLAGLLLELASRHHERFPLINDRTLGLFGQLAKLVVFGGAFYFLCLAWNIPVTGWLASAGVVGLAVGFAAKDTLANLFAGIFILADAPYKVGDFIVLDTGERGEVTHIGLRTTRILTRDDIEITVPNAVIANAKIVNESGGPWEKERVRLQVGVAYGSDIDQVHDVLMEVADPAARHPRRAGAARSLPRLRRLLDRLRAAGLDRRARPAWPGARRSLSSVYRAFGEAGVEIPFPQRDVHVKRPAAD